MIKNPPLLTIRRNFPRPSEAVLRAIRNTPTGFIVDCMNGRGALDYRIEPQNRWQKIGTNTDAGWIAYVWNETALKSTVAHVANAEYPENGGTVTMFNSTSEVFDGKPRFGEIENVGPLSELMPGNTLWMEQELELISGIEADDPERWVEILGAVEEE